MSAMAFQITSFTIVYPTVYSGTDHQTKNQSSASLAFVRGIHRWPVNSPHKGPVTRKMFPLDDGIMEYGRTLEELEVLPQQSKAQQNRCIFHGTYLIPRDLVRLDRSMWHITVVICTGEHWFLLTQLKPESTIFVVTGLGAIWRCARRLTNGSAAFIWKLHSHWLRGLRQLQISIHVVIQAPGRTGESLSLSPLPQTTTKLAFWRLSVSVQINTQHHKQKI